MSKRYMKIVTFFVSGLWLLVVPSLAFATVYYISNYGSDSANGTSQSTPWQTIAQVNTHTFNPGDSILFERGGIWRNELKISSSGAPGNPITIGCYGTGPLPIISGADVIGGWARYSGNIWQANDRTQPNVVIFNSTLGTKTTSLADLAGGAQWFWSSNILYVYSTSNPSAAYTAPGIQAGTRGQAVVVGQSYITIQQLQVEGSNQGEYGGNIFVYGNTPSNIVISSVTSRWSANSGIGINGPTGGSIHIDSCSLYDNMKQGVTVADDMGVASAPLTIENCNVYGNKNEGIAISANYCIIENNIVHDNGRLGNLGTGIHLYSPSSTSGYGMHNIIRYNMVYNQTGSGQDGAGIGIDQWCNYNTVYYNVIYHTDGPGIYIFDANDAHIFNNIVYDSCLNSSGQLTSYGSIRLTSTGISTSKGAEIINNISYATQARDTAIYVDGNYVSNGVTISNNDFYSLSTDWYSWNGLANRNLVSFNSLPGVSGNLNANPLFISTSTPDFYPSYDSPTINAGKNVGITLDFSGNTVPTTPDIGAYEYSALLTAPSDLRLIE